MSTKKLLGDVVALLEKEGSGLLAVEYGRHQKLIIRTPHGPRMLIISVSPSARSLLHIRRDIRRLMR